MRKDILLKIRWLCALPFMFSSLSYAQYVSPANQSYASPGDYISNVSFNTINNTSTLSTSGSATLFGDYSNISTTVNPSSTYSLSVSTFWSEYNVDKLYVYVFFDWNHDYDFTDANEYYIIANGTTHTGSGGHTYNLTAQNITIPSGASLSNIRMRVRMITASSDPGIIGMKNFTGGYFGEIEDYTIVVAAPVSAPTITSISPTSGTTTGGTSVTITGTNFTSGSTVKFGTTSSSSVTFNSATSLTATSPSGSGTVDVTVTTPGGTSTTSTNDQFTYVAAPTISSISPTSGTTTGGTSVTIAGTNFTSGSTVKFGTTSSSNVTFNSATSLTATSPAGSAGTIHITVTTPGGTSTTNTNDQFTYVAAPIISSISPSSGLTTGGTSVTITGSNFTNATAVKFGSSNATGFSVNSATSISATSPSGSGTVDITVTTTGGTSATSAADKFTYLTPGTWTGGAGSSYWTDANNWAGGSVPTSSTDVTIPSSGITYLPMIFPTETAECNNLTTENGQLEIQSSSSGTGSLIVHGTASGKVWSDVYLTAAQWHIVAPSVNGGNISSFLSNSSNGISSKVEGSTTTYAIADYNEGSNAWKSYFTNATWGPFESGKGYLMRRDDANYVSFYGDIITGTKNVSLTKTGQGWNCIGNPYTSAIGMNASASSTENFLTKNSSIFDPNYACVYIWDPVSSTYKIIGNLPSGLSNGRLLLQNYLQVGQAFFVKAKDASQTASFTPAMQWHQTNAPFKAPTVKTSWPGIALNVASLDVSSSAIIAFNEKMTKGLDPTYDAGLLRGTNGLSLYTRLVEDNGVDFAIQCLPENYSNLVIPVGVDCKVGGEITFSAETANLPAECKVVLEDKTNNTFTSLTDGATYKTTVAAGSTAVGRFYIHTGLNTTTGTSGITTDTNSLKAYIANEAIIIEGEVGDQAIATLYNLQGLKVRVNPLQKGSLNSLPCSDLTKGIYLLIIQQNGETATRKLIKE
ncbi:cell surface receptor IPT/TIG domain protein [Paludibacter propionicigenes WB4]|uniref:Cell surface receptor IPT/TIG domain protein n=1 Tax=Paludibacter propionicigenes (strain DSM 17365 / JCM 13257 / WB4) TaxID=694427 RepID=E4T6B9_PALPW|nr:IPT/TIG domain-containing protein [Paludibacter propionicigenes]ADQ80263.1 cell surface receptor IPT/TIG domain protein [Paludibacter propionicigenes WB4]